MPVSQAYQLKDTITGKQNVKRTDTKICYHSSGKIIYAILQPATPYAQSTINVYVYSSSMNKQGETSIVSGINDYYWFDISIVELDNDEILIYAVEWRKTTLWYSVLIVYRFNIVSYTFSTKYISGDIWSTGTSSTSNHDGNLGSIYKYSGDNKFYVSGNSYYYYTGGSTRNLKMFIGKFDSGTNTATVSTTVMGDTYAHPIFDLHKSTAIYNQFIYVITSIDASDTAQLYVIDMSVFTQQFLTNYPAGGTFPNSRRINLLGAGIHAEGNIKYLYFTWEYSYTSASVRFIRLCQSRSIYNITIANANLLASGRSEMIIAPNLATSSTPAWSLGISTIKENATVYFVNIIDSVYHISKYESYIVDWLNYGTFGNWVSEFTAIADNELDITWGVDITNMLIYTPTGVMEVLEQQGNTELYLITPLYIEYDISMSYTPPDNPLLTDNSYLFTFTTYANAIPTALKYVAYFDNSQFGAGITGSNGQKQFTSTTSIAGIHIYTVKLYDLNNVLRRTEDFSYLYKKVTIGTDITQEDALMIGINSLFGVIPQFIIVLLPAILIYQVKNDALMFMVGLTIGSAIGVLSGIIPLYILFIFVLCDILIMFYGRKGQATIGE